MFFGIFHIRYNILDVIRCAILTVSVIAYPQIGFIIGVKTLVILFYTGYEGINILALHIGIEEKILSVLGVVKQVLLGTCTGISVVDSTPLRVCRNQRILVHKTFEGLATRGKCSLGWFFGFKLHLVINDKGEILNFMFSPANVDDREPLKQGNFLKDIKGKLCADKGYIGQALFENLFLNGIQLLTRGKNNMRNSLMSVEDKILLRKRALIETVNDELKNIAQIEHSRHRSFNNFIANALFLKRNLPLMSILSRIGNWRCFKLFRTYVI